MKLNILISTMDERINNVYKILLPPKSDVTYIISHQYLDEKYNYTPENLFRDDVFIFKYKGKGLSKNRNNALKHSDGDIILIADDDVRFLPDSFEIIEKSYLDNPGMDLICFKIMTPENEGEYKAYPENPYPLKEQFQHFISSIEITFRTARIKEADLRFDDRFGLGSFLGWGEEKVFITDAIKKKMNVWYIPQYIVIHPKESTINTLNKYNRKRVFYKGGIEARKYGWFAVPRICLNVLRLYKDLIRHNKNPLIYLLELQLGVFYILLTKQSKY
jgi:glycosyltransferase involved in cell wall biosynthesis